MSDGGRYGLRKRYLWRVAIIAAVLALLALLFLASGHFILGALFFAGAVVMVLAFMQMRSVR